MSRIRGRAGLRRDLPEKSSGGRSAHLWRSEFLQTFGQQQQVAVDRLVQHETQHSLPGLFDVFVEP